MTTAANSAVASLDAALRLGSIVAWAICLVCLAPAVWRLLRGRGLYLDAVWAIVFLLAVNRLSFLLRISPEFSHGSAILLALSMAWFSRWYQRHDA